MTPSRVPGDVSVLWELFGLNRTTGTAVANAFEAASDKVLSKGGLTATGLGVVAVAAAHWLATAPSIHTSQPWLQSAAHSVPPALRAQTSIRTLRLIASPRARFKSLTNNPTAEFCRVDLKVDCNDGTASTASTPAIRITINSSMIVTPAWPRTGRRAKPPAGAQYLNVICQD